MRSDGDVRAELHDLAENLPVGPPPRLGLPPRRRSHWALAAISAVAVVAITFLLLPRGGSDDVPFGSGGTDVVVCAAGATELRVRYADSSVLVSLHVGSRLVEALSIDDAATAAGTFPVKVMRGEASAVLGVAPDGTTRVEAVTTAGVSTSSVLCRSSAARVMAFVMPVADGAPVREVMAFEGDTTVAATPPLPADAGETQLGAMEAER